MIRSLYSSQRVRRRVFFPLGLALFALLLTSCFALFWQKNRCVQEKLTNRLDSVEHLFRSKLEEEANLISGLTDFLERDDRIQKAWLAKDRKKLQESALPVFEEIYSHYRVTHFYFHDLDKVCFLRVHNPPRYGDTIERFTLAEAAGTGETAHGMELGPFGTFTLRVVRPWRVDGRLVGYIELGKEIQQVTTELKNILHAELFFAIEKSRLERVQWEEGLRIMGRTGEWDLAEDFVFIDRTMEEVPPEINRRLNLAHAEHVDQEFTFSMGSRTYHCGIIQLLEAGGRDVGDIFAMIDITESVSAVRRLLAILIGTAVVVAGLLGGFFWSYLGRVQREVARAQYELEIAFQREHSFVDDVAHELRTPLAGMRSTIDVALSYDRQTSEFKESLEDCSAIVEQMESLAGKLLMLARLDDRKAAFQKEKIDLVKLVDDCWKPFRQQAASRQLAFENRVADGFQCVSDRDGLGIILSNLLENGVEYADQGGNIWVTAIKDSKGIVHAAVANTGSRLDRTQASMAFQQFWRADSSRDGGGRHTGLGLPLVRRLATALGGDASADVDEDGVFTVHIAIDGSSEK